VNGLKIREKLFTLFLLSAKIYHNITRKITCLKNGDNNMAECKYLYTYRPSGWVADYWCKSPCHPENLKGNSKTYLVSEIKNLSYDCTHDSCVNCKYYASEINIAKLSEEDKQKVLNDDRLKLGKIGILTAVAVTLIFMLVGIIICSFSREAGAALIGLGLMLSIPLAIYTKYVNG